MSSLYEFQIKRMDGAMQDMAAYRGKVLLIVNTASQCGFTPQYAGLETLYRQYQGQGLEVLGFPCNQFGRQEPGDHAMIQQFCDSRFQLSLPLYAKVDVNGPQAEPMFTWLKGQARGLLGSRKIKWNFTKFLVDREGRVIRRYAPSTTPDKIAKDIEALL